MKSSKRIILMAIALALVVFVTGCSFSFSTAKIEDAIMTNSLDAEGKPGEEVVSFPADVTMIYTSAKLRSAPDNTQIRFVWTYVTDNQLIAEAVVDSGDISDRYIFSNWEPASILPEGDYMVEYFIDDREEPDATVKFVVVAAKMKAASTDGAYLEDTHMTSSVDASGMPVDSITTLATEGTWYVSSILRNTQSDTIIHYTWYDTNGNVVDAFDLDPEGATDVYIFGSFALASVAAEGRYRVEITIDDAMIPAAVVEFDVSNTVVNNTSGMADYVVYSSSDGGFSFEYPSDWKVQEFPEYLAVLVYLDAYAIVGEDSINNAYIYASKGSASSYTIDTLLQTWVDETSADGIENYEYIAQSVDSINGKDIASFSYAWTKGDYQLYNVDALLIGGSNFYVLSLTVTQDAYEVLYPMFEHMVLSFDIL